ncbi:CPBP family intramembrane glutamic endopeptidase [Seonamhaeicola marinus]|uniref:CPBP family intramembrane metalloprotease n=1 Tax=Seonamhaeicola marinus TaxID=1912246 RepID=A0A5D0HSK0_9FLAO|nr:CPBP family intramembrane glutamic endopeptidase [Seonamhaeicola marinus]TYA73930.1 CPBP family intramembrane metalloprotease [Seonamhaeicola marinus]
MKISIPSPIPRNIENLEEHKWKVALTLLLLFIFSAVVNIPFSNEIRRIQSQSGPIDPKLTEPIFDTILNVTVTSAIFGIVFIFLGLILSGKSYLGAPGVTSMFNSSKLNLYLNKRITFTSIIIAIIAALVLLGLLEIQKEFYPITSKHERPSKLFYILGSFVAAVSEEILFRLGIMSAIVAVIRYLRESQVPTNGTYWFAIIVSSLLFGLIHIPMTNNFAELTVLTVSITMIGNLITGTVFGYIFWKWGLLNAMIAHFVFDIVFHVIGTPFG